KSSAQLRLHVEDLPDEQPLLTPPLLAPVVRAVERLTGWRLSYETTPAGPGEVWSTTIDGGSGTSTGRLTLAPATSEVSDGPLKSIAELAQVRPFALAVGGLLSEIHRLKQALREREAELAAGVPIAARKDEEPHLAERLEAV